MNIHPTVFVVVGTVILLFLGILIIAFVVYYQRKQFKLQISQNLERQKIELQYQKKLLENSMEVQEQERRKLAKNLHDEVGAILSVLKMGNNQLFKSTEITEKLKLLVQNNTELIEESINIVRSISKDLVPQTLENFGLVYAIEEFINKINKNSNIQVDFNYENLSASNRFGVNLELAVYRVLQELFNNAIKHSQATEIELFINYSKNQLFLVFEDNGIGFDFKKELNTPSGGLGLRNIQSRLSLIKGEVEISSVEGQGMKFEAILKDVSME
jgi:signal transduction histidine kinase